MERFLLLFVRARQKALELLRMQFAATVADAVIQTVGMSTEGWSQAVYKKVVAPIYSSLRAWHELTIGPLPEAEREESDARFMREAGEELTHLANTVFLVRESTDGATSTSARLGRDPSGAGGEADSMVNRFTRAAQQFREEAGGGRMPRQR